MEEDNSTPEDQRPEPAAGKQDFSYLAYYVYSELPPDPKPADIVLESLKTISIGTPLEEIKLASAAFGLDFIFMKTVARIEFRFRSQGAYGIVHRAVPAEQLRVRQIWLRRHYQSPRQFCCGRLQISQRGDAV